jgi:hypothetical protein
MCIHQSHFLILFCHNDDKGNPTDVTRRRSPAFTAVWAIQTLMNRDPPQAMSEVFPALLLQGGEGSASKGEEEKYGSRRK